MLSRAWLLGVVLASLGAGCVNGPTLHTSLVPTSPFGKASSLPAGPELPPESKDEAIRVARIGQKIVASNPQLTVQPNFSMIGSPGLEIFHRGTQEVFVTEGLAHRCQTEGQLAAVLCQELARMVAEREALQRFVPRVLAERGPPPDVRVGSDYHGTDGPDDGTRQFELGKYENEMRQRAAQSLQPALLARVYLQKAGFPPELLTEVAPLLQAAESTGTLEKQINPRSSAVGRN